MDVETFKKTLSDIGERFIYATVRGQCQQVRYGILWRN